MRERSQDFLPASTLLFPALMSGYFNGGLRSTCFGLDFSLIEEIDFFIVAKDTFRLFGSGTEGHLLQLSNLFLEILVFLFQVPL